MPELPEVQIIVNDLKQKVIGRKIAAFWSDTPRIFRYTTITNIRRGIRNLKIQALDRRGKNIVFHLSKDKMLVIHPKLTGRLLITRHSDPPLAEKNLSGSFARLRMTKAFRVWLNNNYIRAIFRLDNNLILAFSDVRKFGKIMFGDAKKIEAFPDLKKLGPDPLTSLTVDEFKSLISSEKRKIKQVLMDQEVISGIGNIYSDEALWLSKIHPFKPANQLTSRQLTALYSAIRKVLKKSLSVRGSSFRNYRDTEGKTGGYIKIRKVYNREGLPCMRCKTKIKRIKMGARSAHFCPKCQKG